MQAGKQDVAHQDVVKQFKQDLLARGYSARTAEVYATAVSSFLKSVPPSASPTAEDANAYIKGILSGTSKGGASQSSVGIAASDQVAVQEPVGNPPGADGRAEAARQAHAVDADQGGDSEDSDRHPERQPSAYLQLMYSSGLKLDELLASRSRTSTSPASC